MLREQIIPATKNSWSKFRWHLFPAGAPHPHYDVNVRQYLNEIFSSRW